MPEIHLTQFFACNQEAGINGDPVIFHREFEAVDNLNFTTILSSKERSDDYVRYYS